MRQVDPDPDVKRPRTAEELLSLDAEARLLGRVYRAVCPLCGLTVGTGAQHLDSAECLLRANPGVVRAIGGRR
jgi:hypothetical protein